MIARAAHPNLDRTPLRLLAIAAAATIVVWQSVIEFSARLGPTARNAVAEDTFNYLAAAERLNAGHRLYELAPGDRPVFINPPFFTAPLVSPPAIAVLWRPLAALGEPAAWAWFLLCAIAVIGTTAIVLWRSPFLGALLVAISANGIAQQLTSGNVAALFAPAVLVIWAYRDRPWIGAIIGLMGSMKLAPFVLGFWLVATRRWLALGYMLATILVVLLVTAIGAGPRELLAYIEVARTTLPSPWSVSTATGLPWLTYALLAATAAVTLLAARRDGGSFASAVAGFTMFTPAFYPAAMVALPPLAAPIGAELVHQEP